MIEVFHYNDLSEKTAEMPILSGTEKRAINSTYTLQAETLPRILKENNIKITPFTVFKVDGVFYRSKVFAAADNETGIVKIDAVDLLYAELLDLTVDGFSFTSTAQSMLSALLAGTIFSVGICDIIGTKPIDMKAASKQAVLNKILALFNGELERDGLIISIKNKLEHYIDGQPYRLVKGENMQIIEENVDTTSVITQLFYRDSNAASEKDEDGNTINIGYSTITSRYYDNYPCPKQAHKEFRGNADAQALAYLEANELPRTAYKVVVPFNFAREFKLGTVVRLFCEQINIDIQIRVVSIARDLTGQTGDTYTLGQKEQGFEEIAVMLQQGSVNEERLIEFAGEIKEEIEEDVKEEISSKIELKIPEIKDEVFEELGFSDIDDLLNNGDFKEGLSEVAAGNSGHIIIDPPGHRLPQRSKLQFAGAVTVEDDDEWELTRVTFTGSGKNLVIMDHTPTQSEVDGMEEDSLVFVFDPTGSVPSWGVEQTKAAQDVLNRVLQQGVELS